MGVRSCDNQNEFSVLMREWDNEIEGILGESSDHLKDETKEEPEIISAPMTFK